MRWFTCFLLLASTAFAQPVPTPDDSGASAIISDEHGDPIVSAMEYPLGETIVVSAHKSTHGGKPRSVVWVIEPPERARHAVISGDGLTYYLGTGLQPVDITVRLIVALGDEAATTSVTLKCGTGPRPPPKPDPDPKPDPPGPTPIAIEKLQILVIEDTLNRSVATAKLLNATEAWAAFKTAGHDYKFYDSKTSETNGKRYVSEVDGQPLPVLLLRDAAANRKLEAIPLPTTVEALNAAVGKWVKK